MPRTGRQEQKFSKKPPNKPTHVKETPVIWVEIIHLAPSRAKGQIRPNFFIYSSPFMATNPESINQLTRC